MKSSFYLLASLSLLFFLSSCGWFEQEKPDFKAYRVEPSTSGYGAPVEPVTPQDRPLVQSAPGAHQIRQLFSEPLPSDSARINRLEQTVQKLYESLHMKIPAMGSLSALEQNVQNLGSSHMAAEIYQDTNPDGAEPIELVQFGTEPQQGNAVITKTGAKQSPSEAKRGSIGGVQNIRVSQNGNSTRIVFDSDEKITYSLDYDKNEGIVLINAPDTKITGNFSSRAGKSQHIRSLNISRYNSGADVILTLSGPSKVSKPVLIEPNKDSPFYRYFFDIRP